MNCLKHLLVITTLLVAVELHSQTKDSLAIKYAKSITEQELYEHLSVLSSDEYEGREAAHKGEQMAADYLAKEFESYGIPGIIEDGYFQHFQLEKAEATGQTKISGSTYDLINDFVYFRASGNEFDISEMVFAGYGLISENYNDFIGIDVEGKSVLVFGWEPTDKEGVSYATRAPANTNIQKDIFGKMSTAKKMGVKHLFVVYDDFDNLIKPFEHYFSGAKMRLPGSKKGGSGGTMVFMISTEMAESIFSLSKKNIESIKTKINKKGKPRSFVFETSISMNTLSEKTIVEAKNVLGYIEGADLKEELLVITAHYDHLGKHDGEVYNGADDNGTGTVGLIEIAEAFTLAKKEGDGPRRSVLIMPISAEEKGLLGSRYYSDNPVFPLENTVANLNIDMIGRADEAHQGKPKYVYVIGADRLSQELHDINEWANSTYVNIDLDYTFNEPDDPNNFYSRSDHYNFAKHNIPVIFYFSGVHEDYHQATDTFEKIDIEILGDRTKLVFYTAWHLANRDERPKLNEGVE